MTQPVTIALVAGSTVTSLVPAARAQDAGAGWLITPEEAALKDPPAGTGSPAIKLRGHAGPNTGGPFVEMVTPPEGQPSKAPVTIFIKFTPNAAPVDLSTLKVTLVKIIKIDITNRLRPYVSAEGIRIADGKIPTGHFRLRLSVADVNGNVTTGEGDLNIL